MKCPKCGKDTRDQVVNSRPVEKSEGVRRRRECLFCLERWTTYEYSIQDHEMISAELAKHEKKVNALAELILQSQEVFES